MDLIEDVSRASQNLTNELLNTNTGFMIEEEEESIHHVAPGDLHNQPIQPLTGTRVPKHTTIGFHRGGGFQQTDPMHMTM